MQPAGLSKEEEATTTFSLRKARDFIYDRIPALRFTSLGMTIVLLSS